MPTPPLLRAFSLAAAVALSACRDVVSREEHEIYVDQLLEERAALLRKLEAAQREADEANSAAEDAHVAAQAVVDEVERFRFEAWHDVVGDVQRAAEQSASAAEEAASEAKEVEDAVTD